jgi:hypothetical protein
MRLLDTLKKVLILFLLHTIAFLQADPNASKLVHDLREKFDNIGFVL